uniref:Nuclear receptor coactivator 5 n=1 Tax=Monopterus albus TaxID=43700 RepID=A0A3Q3JDL0_MONAL
MAVERRQAKPQSQQSPPRRAPYGPHGDSKDSRPRSRSPVYGREGRDGRDPRDSRDGRDSARDPRPGGHSRDHDYRYRSSESRDKELRADPRDPAYRDDYDRYYRSGSGAEDYYRRKDDPYRDPFRDPWNGRREPEGTRATHYYYEELQRRYDTDRPVDCSVIVVNKAQKEYAETVGRKVRDLGMVVDLIFLNTEVSLTQALEDVGRARTPFAIIITQQHQVHRSCTVNILFGTPQEHRNMPMQDAMMLVAHNYDSYKIENREKEREEIARKAAKMADDVLLREPDRESHPVSVLTTITLLSENRYWTVLFVESIAAPAISHHDVPPLSAGLPPPSHSTHTAPQTSHLGLSTGTSTSATPSHQQELQAKILSLFNSSLSSASQPQAYGSLGPVPSQNPPRPAMSGPLPTGSQGYGTPPPGRMTVPPGGSRPSSSASGINFDNPSVQKALDTLIQSGPSLNHLVGAGTSQQPPSRPGPGMGQVPPMSMYPRHY